MMSVISMDVISALAFVFAFPFGTVVFIAPFSSARRAPHFFSSPFFSQQISHFNNKVPPLCVFTFLLQEKFVCVFLS